MAMLRSTVPLTIRPKTNGRKFAVEIDADRLERLAADLGLFKPEFLASLARAEKEVARGRIRRLRSLRDLRRP